MLPYKSLTGLPEMEGLFFALIGQGKNNPQKCFFNHIHHH
jgi:hypothetical protein